MARVIKFYPNLLLPYLVMFSCLLIPSEIIITRFKVDETSIQLSSGVFKTILYGYESRFLLLGIFLTVLNQLFALLKGFFSEFMPVFITLIYLAFAGFQLILNTPYLDLGLYFYLISCGFILFFNLKQRFW